MYVSLVLAGKGLSGYIIFKQSVTFHNALIVAASCNNVGKGLQSITKNT